MRDKRKDSKGRILRTGESQRSDGRYQYRYMDANKKRQTIYDMDLNSLREKEKEIQLLLSQGINYLDGNIPLSELILKTYALKRNWSDSTWRSQSGNFALIKNSKLNNMPIIKIKKTDIMAFYTELHDADYAYATIASVHSILRYSFRMALEDDAIRKNPCAFSLKAVIDDDTQKVQALTKVQERSLLDFLENDVCGRRYLDMFTILIGTGVRISEFAALTIKDIDFARSILHINKQIVRLKGRVIITKPKTDSGIRDIPMTNAVKASVSNLIARRKGIKKDVMVDGYVGFLSVTKNGKPRSHTEYSSAVSRLVARYNKSSKIKIAKCTPHVLRHTFCTRCIASGMDVKAVQYLMGHSKASTTLDIYTDYDFENIILGMERLENCAG